MAAVRGHRLREVHVAARVLEHAEAGEVLVSTAVPLLVEGSGVEYEDRGEYELNGTPQGLWILQAAGNQTNGLGTAQPRSGINSD